MSNSRVLKNVPNYAMKLPLANSSYGLNMVSARKIVVLQKDVTTQKVTTDNINLLGLTDLEKSLEEMMSSTLF